MLNPTPCVQAVGLYIVPPRNISMQAAVEDEELAQNATLLEMLEFSYKSDMARLLLPDPALASRSPYFHVLGQAGPVCKASARAFIRATKRRRGRENAEEKALEADPKLRQWCSDTQEWFVPDWAVDEKRTTSTILALEYRLTKEDKQKAVCPNLVMDAYGGDKFVYMNFNLKADIMWLDCPFDAEGSVASNSLADQLSLGGFYNSELVALRRLAIEFIVPQFRKACWVCDRLSKQRKHLLEWLDSLRNTPAQNDGTTCLLCSVLAKHEFSDLSAAQKREVKKWFKFERTRGLISYYMPTDAYMFGIVEMICADQSTANPIHGPFDAKAFISIYPLLRRVSALMTEAARDTLPGNDSTQVVKVCLADYDGDKLAYYNEHISPDKQRPYIARQYDEATGVPICLAGQTGRFWHEHRREWCDNTRAAAAFWPVTTPNLETFYVIDRGIKLKPGATIPPGAQTFRGNGCLYVEVPEPSSRSLQKGGEDAVWQYPAPHSWGANVFAFTKHVRQLMRRNQAGLRKFGIADVIGRDERIQQCTRDGQDTTYNRMIRHGKVPECRVLAIVE